MLALGEGEAETQGPGPLHLPSPERGDPSDSCPFLSCLGKRAGSPRPSHPMDVTSNTGRSRVTSWAQAWLAQGVKTAPECYGAWARCPARVRLRRVLLGQRASLHSLRLRFPPRGLARVVRLLPQYYPVVRLLAGVRVGRAAKACSHRSAAFATDAERGLPVLVREGSRRAPKMITASTDRAGPDADSRWRPGRCGLPHQSMASVPETSSFPAPYPARRCLCQRFTRDVATAGA